MPEMVLPDSTPDAVLLNFLRRKRLEEMTHNLSERGRGFSTGATPADAALLQSDINEDPDTGVAAHKAVDDVEAAQAGQAAFMAPGATDVRQRKADETLASFLGTEKAKTDQALRLEAEKNAGALRLQQGGQDFSREMMASGASNDVGGHGFVPSVNAAGAVSLKGIPPHKPTTEEQRALDTMGSLSALGPEMLKTYEAQYPGIEQPGGTEKYGGLYNMLTGAVGAGAYKSGYVENAEADKMTQLTGYLEAVLPRMLSSGRINKEQYLDLKLHVPQVGMSAGANYGRAKYVLDRILPHVRAAIGSTPEGGAASDPYSNPNWGK